MSTTRVQLSIALIIINTAAFPGCDTRRPIRFLIPSGFHGWAKIHFQVPSAPRLSVEDGHWVLRLNTDGTIETSNILEGGVADDEYYYVSGDRRTQLRKTESCGGGSIWGVASGSDLISDRPDTKWFFVGSQAEYRQQVDPGVGFTSHVLIRDNSRVHLNVMLLHGIFPPITTPFYPDGRVYQKKLEHNVEHYSKTPVAGLVVLGSTGEAVMLSDEERRDVLRTAREACAPHKVLIAGTGAESAIETLRLTEYAAELDYDVALVRTPHYYRPQMQPANLLAFYRTVADRSPIPVMIYSVPVFTKYDMPAELVIELAEHPNIVGIKESGGDVEKIRHMANATRHIKRTATVTETFAAVTARMVKAGQAASAADNGEMVPVAVLTGSATDRVGAGAAARPAERSSATPSSPATAAVSSLKTRQKEVGFQLLAGAAQKLHASLDAGAIGGILAFACPAPTACYEIYAAWKEGDAELSQLKQQRISAAAVRVGSELGIAALKYAMDLNGYYGGPARLPLLPLTADLKSEVERLMSDIRN